MSIQVTKILENDKYDDVDVRILESMGTVLIYEDGVEVLQVGGEAEARTLAEMLLRAADEMQ